jgi:hypothetical protein
LFRSAPTSYPSSRARSSSCCSVLRPAAVLLGIFRSPVYIFRSLVYIFWSPVYIFWSPVYIFQSPAYIFRSPVYIFRSLVYIFRSPVYLFRFPVYLFRFQLPVLFFLLLECVLWSPVVVREVTSSRFCSCCSLSALAPSSSARGVQSQLCCSCYLCLATSKCLHLILPISESFCR